MWAEPEYLQFFIAILLFLSSPNFLRMRDRRLASGLAAKIFASFMFCRETGLGLGSNPVKKMTEGNRGKIYLKSSPGVGTKFIVELPGGQHG